MINKKCNRCNKKISKKFDFCPWCGHSFKQQNEKANFGMIGREDRVDGNQIMNEIKLPFGFNKIFNSLMKQIENELSNIEDLPQNPRGIKIQIHKGGKPMQVQKEESPKIEKKEISKREQERRSTLPIVEAESRLKRIGDEIIFEITVPGIKSKEEISITQLEKGIEIKVYTKDLCYTKTIPLEPEKINLKIQKDKVIVESRE